MLGGDGTILESARRAAATNTLVLGLNLGRLGYMAELELSEMEELKKSRNQCAVIVEQLQDIDGLFDDIWIFTNK